MEEGRWGGGGMVEGGGRDGWGRNVADGGCGCGELGDGPKGLGSFGSEEGERNAEVSPSCTSQFSSVSPVLQSPCRF